MSSSVNEGEVKISQTEVTVTKTEVSGSVSDVESAIINDIGKLGKGALKSLDGFRAFILRGNVVDLAIGIVIGAAFTSVVTSLVGDVITPLIPLPGKNSLATLAIPLPSFYPKGSAIHIGLFINAIISFIIVAAVLYFFVVQPVGALMKAYHGKDKPTTTTRECPYCFQEVNLKASRCPFCTSRLKNNGEAHEHEEEASPVLMLPSSLEALSDKLADRIVKKATTALERGVEVTSGEEASSEAASGEDAVEKA